MRSKFGLLESDLTTIIDVLKRFNEVEYAFIFGSRAKGNYRNGSDVDIALKGEKLDFNILSRINSWLNEETALPYTFDVLNYHTLSEPDLIEHIDRVGIQFYSK